jgi:DNA polymerase sigma
MRAQHTQHTAKLKLKNKTITNNNKTLTQPLLSPHCCLITDTDALTRPSQLSTEDTRKQEERSRRRNQGAKEITTTTITTSENKKQQQENKTQTKPIYMHTDKESRPRNWTAAYREGLGTETETEHF